MIVGGNADFWQGSTCLTPFGPRSDSLADLAAWCSHIKQHVAWIDAERADNRHYCGIRSVYTAEFFRASIALRRQRLQLARAA